jgi:hypothetical protein
MNKEKLVGLYEEYIHYKIKDIYKGIKRIPKSLKSGIKFFKVGYHHRPWDYVYFLRVMSTSLGEFKHFYTHDAKYNGNRKKILREITKTKEAIDRLIAQDYNVKDTKFMSEIVNTFVEIPDTEYKRLVWMRNGKSLSKKEETKMGKEIQKRRDKEQKLIDKDLNTVGENIKNSLMGWWD